MIWKGEVLDRYVGIRVACVTCDQAFFFQRNAKVGYDRRVIACVAGVTRGGKGRVNEREVRGECEARIVGI